MSNKGKHSRRIKFNMKTGALGVALSAMLCGAIGLGVYGMNAPQAPQVPSSSAAGISQSNQANVDANTSAADTAAQPQENAGYQGSG